MSLAASFRMVTADQLRVFIQQAFQRVGCSECDASAATDVLMWASLRGVDTHGVRNLLPYYLKRIQSGEVEASPQIATLHSTNSTVRLDGGGGLGLVTAGAAMRIAMQKAKDVGVGIATVENTHHLGPAGYHASLALEQDMLGVCVSGHFFGQGNEVGVAPINSAQAMFSTNPVSFAAPTADRPPFLLDMATATTTVNRIEAFAQAGQLIPTGWAKDASGKSTNDPTLATVLNPLGCEPTTGGHKGIALSMLVSILSGVLTGAWKEVKRQGETRYAQDMMGHFLAAIRIDQFMSIDEFKTSLDAMVDALLASPRLNQTEPIRYPGSQEYDTCQTRLREGIPVDERLFKELEEVRQSLSLSVSLV